MKDMDNVICIDVNPSNITKCLCYTDDEDISQTNWSAVVRAVAEPLIDNVTYRMQLGFHIALTPTGAICKSLYNNGFCNVTYEDNMNNICIEFGRNEIIVPHGNVKIVTRYKIHGISKDGYERSFNLPSAVTFSEWSIKLSK